VTGTGARLPPAVSPVLRASLTEQLRALTGTEPIAELLDVRVERVTLPDGPAYVVRPADWSALRAAESAARRPTPYWAVPWPSGQVLARTLAAEPPRGLRVLELGCGLGLPSIVAARNGAARVLATDGQAEAIVFAAHALALNEVEAETAVVDWADDGEALEPGAWDLVLAADVLYTRENVDTLIRLLPRLLAPRGEAWIADPRRAGAEELLPIAKRLWRVDSAPAPDDDRVLVHRLRPRG
jgi:predicted nicotinamide N-methyase